MGLFGKHLEADAVILLDEGEGRMMETDSHGIDWEWHKYVVEVHPAGEAPFRAESKTKVQLFYPPKKGDTVKVLYDPKKHTAEIKIEGDPRFDAKVQRDQNKQQKQDNKERAKALLAGENPEPASGGWTPSDDPEIADLEMVEKLEAEARNQQE